MLGLAKIATSEQEEKRSTGTGLLLGGLTGAIGGGYLGGKAGEKSGRQEGQSPAFYRVSDTVEESFKDKEEQIKDRFANNKKEDFQKVIWKQRALDDIDYHVGSIDSELSNHIKNKDAFIIEELDRYKDLNEINYLRNAYLTQNPQYALKQSDLNRKEQEEIAKTRYQEKLDRLTNFRNEHLEKQKNLLLERDEMFNTHLNAYSDNALKQQLEELSKQKQIAIDDIPNSPEYRQVLNQFGAEGRKYGTRQGALLGLAGLGTLGAIVGSQIKKKNEENA